MSSNNKLGLSLNQFTIVEDGNKEIYYFYNNWIATYTHAERVSEDTCEINPEFKKEFEWINWNYAWEKFYQTHPDIRRD